MELERLEKLVGINKIRLNLRKNRLICPLQRTNRKQNSLEVGREMNAMKSKCLESRNAV